jgi:hypothetical protein
LTTLKMAALAPMPSASVRMTISENPRAFHSDRAARRTSRGHSPGLR